MLVFCREKKGEKVHYIDWYPTLQLLACYHENYTTFCLDKKETIFGTILEHLKIYGGAGWASAHRLTQLSVILVQCWPRVSPFSGLIKIIVFGGWRQSLPGDHKVKHGSINSPMEHTNQVAPSSLGAGAGITEAQSFTANQSLAEGVIGEKLQSLTLLLYLSFLLLPHSLSLSSEPITHRPAVKLGFCNQ